MNSRPLRHTATISLTGLFLSLVTLTAAKSPPTMQTLDVGTYRLEVATDKHWTVEAKPEQGYVLFHYSDAPAMTENATIGLFRIVIPEAARVADRSELAGAYATLDLSGAQQGLFKSNAHLMRMGKKTKSINEGELFSFGEKNDALGIRVGSSRFIRAWVFFPKTFATDGVAFLVLGKEDFVTNEVRPAELARAEEIIAGLRAR